MFYKLVLTLNLVFVLIGACFAQEIIPDFKEESVPILNEELRRINNVAFGVTSAESDIDDLEALHPVDLATSEVNGILTMNKGGTEANLTDPGADRMMFWDDGGTTMNWLEPGDNLSITGTILNATIPVGVGASFHEDTKLMLHCNGEDTVQALTNNGVRAHIVTFVNTAQLDIDGSPKFEQSALLLDGNSDYLTLPDSDEWNFGTNDFTLELWARFNDRTSDQILINQYVDSDNYWRFNKPGDEPLHFISVVGTTTLAEYTTTANVITANDTWYHIMAVRSGNNFYIFVDGDSKALTVGTSISGKDLTDVGAGLLGIGATSTGGTYLDGWVDEVRVVNGTAINSANFTPPTNRTSVINSVYRD